jgi:hypothetical protein
LEPLFYFCSIRLLCIQFRSLSKILFSDTLKGVYT